MGVGVGMNVGATDTEAYREHKIVRQIAAQSVSATLSLAHAAGIYRINKALFETNPDHPFFQNGSRTLYEEDSHWGRTASKIFLPGRRRKTEALHRSGLRWKNFASWGAALPLAGRLAANLYVTNQAPIAAKEGSAFLQKAAINLDSTAMALQGAETLLFCGGQQMTLHNRWRGSAAMLRLGWRGGIAGGGFQMGAGLLRLEQEMEHYFETGKINNSTVFYGAADAFWGGSGIAWSHEVLKEARAARSAAAAGRSSAAINRIGAEHHALLGMIEPAARVKIGLRVAGSVASVVGLGFNLYDLGDAITDDSLDRKARNKRILSDGIGIAGSCLMIAAGLMVGTALAPLAGVALAAGTAAFIGQTVLDYWG